MQSPSVWLTHLALEQPRLLVLTCLLVVAAWIDLYRWRIPNALTFGGSLSALLMGLLEPGSPMTAIGVALGGLALGLFVMLPMYLMRALGAGDVKLMAMVGAFLGVAHIPGAALLVFITGGVMAALLLLHRRTWPSIRGLLRVGLRPGLSTSGSLGRMPYALSIGVGTLLYVAAFEPQGLQWSRD